MQYMRKWNNLEIFIALASIRCVFWKQKKNDAKQYAKFVSFYMNAKKCTLSSNLTCAEPNKIK